MYGFQLEAFLEHFPVERILLVTAEDLKDARGEMLRKIFRFIGVDPRFEGSDVGRLFNQTPALGGAALGDGDRNRVAVSRSGQGPDALQRPAFAQEDRDR